MIGTAGDVNRCRLMPRISGAMKSDAEINIARNSLTKRSNLAKNPLIKHKYWLSKFL
jgi:hypothetical protein